MKNLLLLIVALIAGGTACSRPQTEINEKEFVGSWIEENNNYRQGFNLKADGMATSIGTATLKYENWKSGDGQIILTGKSIGNGQTINFSETMLVIELTPDTMTLQRDDYRIKYHKEKKPKLGDRLRTNS